MHQVCVLQCGSLMLSSRYANSSSEAIVRRKLTDRKLAGRPYTTPLDPQMTVAPSSDTKAAAGLWSKKKAIDISATDPSRKGMLECSRVSPAAAIMPVFIEDCHVTALALIT